MPIYMFPNLRGSRPSRHLPQFPASPRCRAVAVRPDTPNKYKSRQQANYVKAFFLETFEARPLVVSFLALGLGVDLALAVVGAGMAEGWSGAVVGGLMAEAWSGAGAGMVEAWSGAVVGAWWAETAASPRCSSAGFTAAVGSSVAGAGPGGGTSAAVGAAGAASACATLAGGISAGAVTGAVSAGATSASEVSGAASAGAVLAGAISAGAVSAAAVSAGAVAAAVGAAGATSEGSSLEAVAFLDLFLVTLEGAVAGAGVAEAWAGAIAGAWRAETAASPRCSSVGFTAAVCSAVAGAGPGRTSAAVWVAGAASAAAVSAGAVSGAASAGAVSAGAVSGAVSAGAASAGAVSGAAAKVWFNIVSMYWASWVSSVSNVKVPPELAMGWPSGSAVGVAVPPVTSIVSDSSLDWSAMSHILICRVAHGEVSSAWDGLERTKHM